VFTFCRASTEKGSVPRGAKTLRESREASPDVRVIKPVMARPKREARGGSIGERELQKIRPITLKGKKWEKKGARAHRQGKR